MSEHKKVKRPVRKALEGVKFAPPSDAAGLKACPTLYDLLSPKWQDGKLVLEGGRMSVKADGPCFRVSIELPSEGLQTTFIVESLLLLAETSEKILSQGHIHWGLTWARQKKHVQSIETAIE